MRPVWLLLVACFAAAGCSPLAPRPEYTKYFVLSPITDAAGAPSVGSALPSPLVLGIGPIEFPGYLKRPEVVTRIGANQLDLSGEARWAEPLDRNFGRVLSANLSQLLGTDRIHDYPWSLATTIDYQIIIHVQTFEAAANEQAQLRASWTIRSGKRGGGDLYSAETTADAPTGGGEAGISAALSTDVATLSRAIAAKITELAGDASGSRSRIDGSQLVRIGPRSDSASGIFRRRVAIHGNPDRRQAGDG